MVEKCSLGHIADPITKECDEGHIVGVQVCFHDHDYDLTTKRFTVCGQFNSTVPITEDPQPPPQQATEAFMKTMMKEMKGMKSEYMKPPEFFRDKGSFKQYKKDFKN